MVLAGKTTPFRSFMLLYITHVADIQWNRKSMKVAKRQNRRKHSGVGIMIRPLHTAGLPF